MKRALIRRNKTFLSEMLKSARMNTVSLSMMLDLCKQKTIFRMTDRLNNRWRLKENWHPFSFPTSKKERLTP
ncbi:hypothetical protein K9U65_10255 [Providencia stuartii]|uniref:hypothetical protein n=1 Tax=Providencia stuartii TaxID=588 RepID=UPI003316E5A3